MEKCKYVIKGYIDFLTFKGEIQGVDVAETTSCKIHVTAESPKNVDTIINVATNIQETNIPGAKYAINAKNRFDVAIFNADGTQGIAENGCEAYFIVTPYEYGGKKGIAKGVAFNLNAIKLTGKQITIKHGVQVTDFGDDF